MTDRSLTVAIDYDGSASTQNTSRNYDLEEYCRDCVYHVQEICAQDGVPPPTLVTDWHELANRMNSRAT